MPFSSTSTRGGTSPEQHLHARLEPFELADLRVVSLQDSAGPEPVAEDAGDVVAQGVGGLREGLDDEVVAVAVDDEGGDAVPFAVDQAAGPGAGCHGVPPAHGLRRGAAGSQSAASVSPREIIRRRISDCEE